VRKEFISLKFKSEGKIMKKLAKFTTIAMLAAAPFAASISTNAYATEGRLAGLKSEAYRSCQVIRGYGYTGIVRGKTSGGTTYGGDKRFTVRYCFETASQCTKFINNIENILHNVTQVNFSTCKPR